MVIRKDIIYILLTDTILQIIVAIIPESKIIELFFGADKFCKFFTQ